MNSSPTISAIVTFHNEGKVALNTLAGMERVRRYTENNAVSVEFVAVLDSANQETMDFVRSCPVMRRDDQIIEVTNRDLGSSRNSGIRVARGQYIGIFDGDDFYSDDWLMVALSVAQRAPDKYIVHPELQISFGATHCVARLLDMREQEDYPMQNCLAVHPWIACSFAARQIYESTPYCRSDTRETGFGFEDWHWNLETISKGSLHVVAPQTAHFYRRKPSSMLTEMVASNALIRPTAFFDYPERWNCQHRSNTSPKEATESTAHVDPLLPAWAIEGFKRLAEIELELFPTPGFIDKFSLYSPPFVLGPGELYWKCHSLSGDFTPEVICIVPRLDWGSTANSVWQTSFQNWAAGKNVLVISTAQNDTATNKPLPERYRLIEFGSISDGFSEDEKVKALIRLIIQSPARDIVIGDSPLAWQLATRYCKQILATAKKIYTAGCNVESNPRGLLGGTNGEVTLCLGRFSPGEPQVLQEIAEWEGKTKEYLNAIATTECRSDITELALPGRPTLWRRSIGWLKRIGKAITRR